MRSRRASAGARGFTGGAGDRHPDGDRGGRLPLPAYRGSVALDEDY